MVEEDADRRAQESAEYIGDYYGPRPTGSWSTGSATESRPTGSWSSGAWPTDPRGIGYHEPH